MERVDFRTAKEVKENYSSLIDHMWRYLYAMRFIREKVVLDAACGSGYGARMLSWGAKRVTGVDKDISFTEDCGPDVKFIQVDLNKDILPAVNTCVSFETIEHLENPEFFLSNLLCDELIFSIPLDSPPNEFHKIRYKEPDIMSLLEKTRWKLQESDIQDKKYFYGRAIR